MKKWAISTKTLTIVIVLLIAGCESNNITTDSSQTTYDYFKQNLAHDSSFKMIINSSKEFVNFASNESYWIDKNFNKDKFQKEITKRKSKNEVIGILSKYTTKPNQYYNLIQKKYAYQQKFIAQNPTFRDLSKREQKKLINNAIIEAETFTKKKQISTYSIPRMKVDDIEPDDENGQCEKQLMIDLRGCHITQYTAAAFCGLLTPTLPLALGCGAGVVFEANNCHKTAKATYQLCKAYEDYER